MSKPKTARTRGQLMQGRRDWYRIENFVDAPDKAAIYVYDEIGYWGVTAADFVRDLSGITASQIDLHINSPGGEVYEGIAIHSAIRNHKANVTVYIDGLAASAASFIAMAGDTVKIARNAQLMIHEASGLCIGNASDFRDMADRLDMISDNIADMYAQKAGGTVSDWRAAMLAETWYSGEEALAAGLVDEVIGQSAGGDGEPVGVVENSWDLSIFTYAGRECAPAPNLKSTRTAGEPIPQLRNGQSPPLLVPEAVPVDAPLTLDQVAAAFGLPLNHASEGEPQAVDTPVVDEPVEDGGGEDTVAHGLAAATPDVPEPAPDQPVETPPGDIEAEPAVDEPTPVVADAGTDDEPDPPGEVDDAAWAELTAHLLETPASPSSDDVLKAFREALL